MDKLKVYQVATFSMILLNLSLLAFLFLGGPGHNRANHYSSELELDAEQKSQFQQLTKDHSQLVRRLNEQEVTLLEAYFQKADEFETPPSFPAEVLDIKQQKVTATFQHFQDIKSILRPEQKELFPSFINQSLERILRKRGKKGKRNKKGKKRRFRDQ